MDTGEILETFGFFRSAPADLQDEIRRVGEHVNLAVGSYYFQEGSSCPNVAFVGEGNVRVFKISREGREITLYHVAKGQTCLLTLNAAMGRSSYPASAIAETPVEAVLVPADLFRSWVDRHPSLRAFVFSEMAQRIASLMTLIHEVVFRRIDQRLAGYLLRELAAQDPPGAILDVTHGVIAAELGSAREVISRGLKELEHEGSVVLGRGQIQVVDEAMLRRLATPPAVD